jgi:hypothetical protein
MSTFAPATFNLLRGTSSFDCSNPSVARTATRLPLSYVRLLAEIEGRAGNPVNPRSFRFDACTVVVRSIAR